MRVGVVGAGVVGLCTAMEVQQELGCDAAVSVIADKFNEDTTGHGAAGFWLPASYFMGPSYEITRRWLQHAFAWYSDLCHSDQALKAGIAELSGYFFSNQSDVTNHWLVGLLPEYRRATEEELEMYPGGARYGAYARTLVTECRYFLPWALDRIQTRGGRIEQRKVDRLGELSDDFDVVFNCTGLGSKALCNDHILMPVRGQVYKVVAPWIKRFMYEDNTYIIPNRQLVTLGGSRQLGDWNLNVDRHESASIWERCLRLEPSLVRARVQQQWVGLRPFRCPVRVEAESVQVPGRSSVQVIHNYGHGGYGITSAPGTAKHAVSLLINHHKASAGSSKL